MAMAEASPIARVDAHAHIFTRAMPFAADAHSRPAYAYPVEAWLDELDRHGITHGVIAAASLYADHNAYTLGALRAYPARLRATVIVAPETDAHRLRAMSRQGVVGVRLTWRRQTALPDLSAQPWQGFLRRLSDCGMHVELLAGSTQLPHLLPRIAASGVGIVVDHFGVPSHDPIERSVGTDALIRAADTGRTWVKLSAGFRLPPDIVTEVATRLLADVGPERLLWGSDAPFVNHEATACFGTTLATYHALVPDRKRRAAIDRTALALYFNEGCVR